MVVSSDDEDSDYTDSSSEDDGAVPPQVPHRPHHPGGAAGFEQTTVIDSDDAGLGEGEGEEEEEVEEEEEEQEEKEEEEEEGVGGEVDDQRMRLTRRLGKLLQKFIKSGSHVMFSVQLEEAFSLHVEREVAASTVAAAQMKMGKKAAAQTPAPAAIAKSFVVLYREMATVLVSRLRFNKKEKLAKLVRGKEWGKIASKYSKMGGRKKGKRMVMLRM